MAQHQEQLMVLVTAETGEVATLRTGRIANRIAVLVYLLHQARASRCLLCLGSPGRESQRGRKCEDADARRSSVCTAGENVCCGGYLGNTQVPCDVAHHHTLFEPQL